MKLLMIGSELPEGAGKLFNLPEAYFAGWLTSIVGKIAANDGIDVSFIVFIEADKNEIDEREKDGITYYRVKYNNSTVISQFFTDHLFDIYHVFGIELKYTKDIYDYLPIEKTLFYIQGFACACYRHFFGNLRTLYPTNPIRDYTMSDMLTKFKNSAVSEDLILRTCKYITGRTDFCKAILFEHHCNAKYYHLNESLRDPFYSADKWDIQNIKRHSIFVSQASYPIKGTWMIIEIVRVLKEYYPDVTCYISGTDIFNVSGIATKLRVSFVSQMQDLIFKYGLKDNFVFTGPKSAEEMIPMYQQANVYLLASTIENSSNSLQEAMFLGTPCVSSNVGGISSIVESNQQALLYPADDIAQGAYAISKIFENDELAKSLSVNGQKRVSELVDREKNLETLLDIYKDMLENH